MDGNCQACGKYGRIDKHHLKTRGSGGSNDEFNLIQLCRSCHQSIHHSGSVKFIKRFPKLQEILKAKGWKTEIVFGLEKLKRGIE